MEKKKLTKISFISDFHWDLLNYPWKGYGREELKSLQKAYQEEYTKILTGELGEVCVNLTSEEEKGVECDRNILLLLGDFVEIDKIKCVKTALERAVEKYDHIYWVFGNHEFYNMTLERAPTKAQEFIKGNKKLAGKVSIIENETISVREDLQILAATYWYSSRNPVDDIKIKLELNDFRKIRRPNFSRIDVSDFFVENTRSIEFFSSELQRTANQGIKTILATHHSTSDRCIIGTVYEHQPDSVLGFSSVLPYKIGDYIEQSNIIACLHGHTHQKGVRCYENEWGVPTYQNTVGYANMEYKLGQGCKVAYLLV